MRKYKFIPAWMMLLPLLLGAAPIEAVEIPEEVKANCVRGEFGENKYVDLKVAVVGEWLDASSGEEAPVAVVRLEFRPPEGGDQPEKIETAFMIMDENFNQVSPVLGGGVRSSGTVPFKWDAKDRNGKPVREGAYKVLMNITGEHHGDLLVGAVFPLYLVTAPPVASNPEISSRKATLEYDGAPILTYSSTSVGIAEVTDSDTEGNEVFRWEGVVPPGKHTMQSDLKDKDGDPFVPGEYTTRVIVRNPLGESDTLEFRYELAGPPPLEAEVKLDAPASLKVKDEDVVPFTVTLNQPARVRLRHVADNGKTDLVGQSVEGDEFVLLPKGTSSFVWRRVDMSKFEFYETGVHWINAVARTLAGGEIEVDSNRVALSPAPKPPPPKAQPRATARQEPKRGIPNLKLSLTPEHVVIGGGRMVARISYTLDQDGMIKVRIYDKRGKLVRTAIDSRNEFVKKGSYWKEIDVEDYDYGSYKVVFGAVNFYGERKVSKNFSVGWR